MRSEVEERPRLVTAVTGGTGVNGLIHAYVKHNLRNTNMAYQIYKGSQRSILPNVFLSSAPK